MCYIIIQQCYTRARSSANKQALNFPAYRLQNEPLALQHKFNINETKSFPLMKYHCNDDWLERKKFILVSFPNETRGQIKSRNYNGCRRKSSVLKKQSRHSSSAIAVSKIIIS